MNQLFTIGHSNQSQEEFLAMLRRYGVDCVVDVRSVPASKYSPQFNMEVLRRFLKQNGVEYLHFGREFGARRTDCINKDGQVDFRIVSVVPLKKAERRTIRKAFVIPSQNGLAVCFRRRNGGEDFLPIDHAEGVEAWQKISPGKIDIVTYSDGHRAVNVRNSGGVVWRWIQNFLRFPKFS